MSEYWVGCANNGRVYLEILAEPAALSAPLLLARRAYYLPRLSRVVLNTRQGCPECINFLITFSLIIHLYMRVSKLILNMYKIRKKKLQKSIPNTTKPEKCSGGRVHFVVQPGSKSAARPVPLTPAPALAPADCVPARPTVPRHNTRQLCNVPALARGSSAADDPRPSPLGRVLASGQLLAESTCSPLESLQLPFRQLSAKAANLNNFEN